LGKTFKQYAETTPALLLQNSMARRELGPDEAMKRGVFGCARSQRYVPPDPTNLLLPNPNSARSEIGISRNLAHREWRHRSLLAVISGIKSDTLALRDG
jgi:hypothetical protein